MKNHIIKSVLIIVWGILNCISGFGADYGANKKSCDIRYFVTSGTVKVYEQNSSMSKIVRVINAGDYIYVDQDKLYYTDGQGWVKISGTNEYILSYLLTIEDNPHYVPKKNDNLLKSKKSIFKFGFYDLPKWLVITMLSVWILLSFILCLIEAIYIKMDLRWCPPDKKPKILENPDPEYGYGQPKVLFFSKAPYRLFINVARNFIIAFVVTILLFILIGSLVWLFTWMGRILLISLFWVLVVGLIALGMGLLINSLFGEDARFLSLIFCWLPVFIAIKMIGARLDVYEWGSIMTDWGTKVFTTFNIIKVSIYIVKTYWLTALIIAVTPLVLFMGAAALFMLFASGLMLYEKIKMKHYNVNHPCPFCGEHSEPAIYLSDGIPLHVPLQPSVWGMFNICHPATGEKMPTLFLNGKDRLERRCAHCDGLISANIGAEKHVAVAGVPNSGKSTLLFRIISELCRMQVGNENICSRTDNLGEDEAFTDYFLKTIDKGQKMDEFPQKTAEGRHKSIQLLAQNPNGSLPYRLYINDIAGEMFTSTNNQYEDAPFFKNTNVLIFALDPFTMKANELDFSSRFASWYKNNVGDKKDLDRKVDLDEAFTALINTISKYKKEKDLAKIKLMITFVKTDTGYLKGVGNDSASLREFAISDMGLESIVRKFEDKGFNVSYHAVSASENAAKSGVSSLIDEMLGNLGISFKNLSEKQLVERKSKMHKREVANRQNKAERRNYTPKNPNEFNSKIRIAAVTISFIIAGLIALEAAKITSKVRMDNYNETLALIKKASAKPLNYSEVMSIIEESVAVKSLSESQKTDLTSKYNSADREKRKHISKLRSILYANFESKKGRMSNIELSLKYKALDVEKIQQYFDEFEILAPEDAQYLKYRKQFEELLTKYNVTVK